MNIYARIGFFTLLPIALHATAFANALDPIILISASRSNTVTASATGGGMTATDSKSTPSNQFGSFDSTLDASAQEPGLTVGGGNNSAHSSATQQSNITDSLFSLSQSLEADSGGALGGVGPGGAVDANATSFFQVRFSVPQPVMLSLAGERDANLNAINFTYDEQFLLSSLHHGEVNFAPQLALGPVPFSLDQLLLPGDIYSLIVSQTVDEQSLDPIGPGLITADAQLTASFRTVPDRPMSFTLFALGLAAILAYRHLGGRADLRQSTLTRP